MPYMLLFVSRQQSLPTDQVSVNETQRAIVNYQPTCLGMQGPDEMGNEKADIKHIYKLTTNH